jgi:hypothetical protein
VKKKSNWKALIKSLPPGLTFSQAAKRLRRDYQCTRQAIFNYGYRAVDGRHFTNMKTRKVNPDKIDWRKSNIQIARELLVSRERIRFVRKRDGKPKVEARGRPRHCE